MLTLCRRLRPLLLSLLFPLAIANVACAQGTTAAKAAIATQGTSSLKGASAQDGSATQAAYREQQTTSTVFMVSPDDFGFNVETAASNAFQDKSADIANAQQQARREFDATVERLRGAGIRVIVLPSRKDVRTPDAVFPNNWFSLHEMEGGKRLLVGYPMLAPNRRAERRLDELQTQLAADGLRVDRVIDLSAFEQQGRFLEGTGSMVLDRANRIAYASLSPRTDAAVLEEFGGRLQYRPVSFRSYDSGGALVYHTNVMMSVGSRFAVICAESIRDVHERTAVMDALRRSGKEVITITLAQMAKMCGNILELRTARGPVIVMSQTAYDNFTPEQRSELQRFGTLLAVPIHTIEAIGGGSARCMLGEVF